MSTIGAVPTLADVIRLNNPGGGLLKIADRVAKTTSIVRHIPMYEATDKTSHVFAAEAALPAVSWRSHNEGVTASKSVEGVVTETIGKLSGLSKIDEDLCLQSNNPAEYRMKRDGRFYTAMEEELEQSAFYGSQKIYPERITGLAPRLDGITTGPWKKQVIASELSSSGNDQTSVFMAVWGEETVHGVYPKGGKGGLEIKDLGRQVQEDAPASGKWNRYLLSEFNWQIGLAVIDPRYIARLCNIDMGNIAATGSQLLRDLLRLKNTVKDIKKGRAVMYMCRDLYTYLDLQVMDQMKGAGGLTYANVAGERILTFQGVELAMSDMILKTEAPLT